MSFPSTVKASFELWDRLLGRPNGICTGKPIPPESCIVPTGAIVREWELLWRRLCRKETLRETHSFLSCNQKLLGPMPYDRIV
jgi:hypothetical protein